MQQRPFGTTGLHVTRMGIGLAALGRPGYITLNHADDLGAEYDPAKMQQHAHNVLDAAWEAGIRYYDAARSYGKAEQFLGAWLPGHADCVVASKWGYTYTADWQVKAEQHEVKEHSLAVLQRQWQETQANLGDYLRIYQVHSATLSTGILENSAVLDRLLRLKQQGVVIGLTLSGPGQAKTLRKAIAVRVDGIRLFDSVQVTWNLLEKSTGEILEDAHASGMGVVIKEVLANGRLTPRNDDPDFAPKRQKLEEQAQRLNTTIDALALAAALAQPWVDVVLSGAARVEHVHSNVKALEVAWDAEAAHALADLTEPPEVYWHKRDNLAWN